ncbi:helix-turn-helix domain-containing protein [Streptomyces sp. NPDC048516]|uniref:helix-turn-helix domain-containing protein n=1 Tax=Streptomyces sp. NPDC048516 TaxID=3365565 RepID=UPI0037165B4F
MESSRLAVRMRELRERTGLTLAGLAERTPYSKSSWERYLNAKKLPPRGAVEALCLLAGEPPGGLLALWELADAAWSGRGRPDGSGSGLDGSGSGPDGSGSRLDGSGSGSTGSKTRRRGTVPGCDAAPDPGGAQRRGPGPGPGSGPGSAAAGAPSPRLPQRVVAVVAGAGVGLAVIGVAVGAGVLTFGVGERGVGSGPGKGAAPVPSEVIGCRAGACDGKDPESMYCELPDLVVTPVERTAARGEHVQIRYGEACGAAWGRLRNGRVGDRLEVSVPGARPRSVRVVDRFDAEGYLVTPMAVARGPEGIRLCLYPAGGGAGECFAP